MNRRRRAVTLVELVATLAIGAILAGVAVGGLVGVQTWRETAAVRRLQADLNYARARAMLSGRRTLFRFDTGRQAYTLLQEAQPGEGDIQGSPMSHPQTGETWQVRLADLGSLRVQLSGPWQDGTVGFGTDGRPLTRQGRVLNQDLQLKCSNGARLILRAGSGICEAVWP